MYSETRSRTALVLGLIILAALMLRMQAFLIFPCPPGSDPGLRVKNAYLLSRERVNVTYPAFDATLSLLWVSTGASTTGLILSTELFVSLVMAFSAASMYSVSFHVFKDRRASLVAAFLAAFSASAYELVSFGSYPQGLSLFLIPLIFALALKRNFKSEIPQAVSSGILAAGLLMMHFWSFAICTIAILLFLVASYIRSLMVKDREDKSATKRILTVTPLLALLFSSPWWAPIFPFLLETLLYAPVGATGIRGVGVRFERFFSPYWLYYVFLPAGLIGFHSRLKHRNTEGLILVGSWFLTPLILMQAYQFGIGADYRRLWYYPSAPAMIVAGLGFSFTASLMFHALGKIIDDHTRANESLEAREVRFGQVSKPDNVKLRSALAISVVLVMAAVVLSPGWWAVREANSSTKYYSHIREPELGMMSWIGGHVEEGMEILSGGSVGWWIRGLAGRHVVSVIPRAFINVPWQISQAETAGILVSEASYAMKNDWIEVRDSGPYWSGFNPDLSVNLQGDYRSVMHLNDTGILLRLSNGQKVTLASIISRESSWISRTTDAAALQTRYTDESLTVTKTISLRGLSSLADIELRIRGIRTDVRGLTVVAYPNEDLGYSVILAEGLEWKLGDETNRYVTAHSRWFALYDQTEDFCLVVALDGESSAQFNMDGMRLISVELDLKVEDGRSNIRVGGFIAEDSSQLHGSIEHFLEEEVRRKPEEPGGQVSTLDYLEALREYRIRIIVIGTVEKHAMDPHLNLVFSTGGRFIFESP